MSSRPAPRRRFRVVARPQERARRARLLAAFAAVALLGVVAAASARHAASALSRARLALPAAVTGEPEAALVEAPEPLRAAAQAAADRVAGPAGAKAEAIKAAFPCVAGVAVRRAWGERRATLGVALKAALAPALKRGRPAGWLGADGTVFEAPAGLYALSGPTADAAGASDADLKALAKAWPALAASGALPAPLSEAVFAGPDAGWELRLADGTTVLWGRLDWTKEKLARLREALADARAKAPGAFAADLRWFEDGKVVLKPLPQTVAARGGLR